MSVDCVQGIDNIATALKDELAKHFADPRHRARLNERVNEIVSCFSDMDQAARDGITLERKTLQEDISTFSEKARSYFAEEDWLSRKPDPIYQAFLRNNTPYHDSACINDLRFTSDARGNTNLFTLLHKATINTPPEPFFDDFNRNDAFEEKHLPILIRHDTALLSATFPDYAAGPSEMVTAIETSLSARGFDPAAMATLDIPNMVTVFPASITGCPNVHDRIILVQSDIQAVVDTMDPAADAAANRKAILELLRDRTILAGARASEAFVDPTSAYHDWAQEFYSQTDTNARTQEATISAMASAPPPITPQSTSQGYSSGSGGSSSSSSSPPSTPPENERNNIGTKLALAAGSIATVVGVTMGMKKTQETPKEPGKEKSWQDNIGAWALAAAGLVTAGWAAISLLNKNKGGPTR